MNSLVALCLLVVAGFTIAGAVPVEEDPRNCLYILGKCHRDCEAGTHSYSVDCDYMTPEPTCDQPHPVQDTAIICDFSACYCDSPTVRDTTTNKCVTLDKCPKKVVKKA